MAIPKSKFVRRGRLKKNVSDGLCHAYDYALFSQSQSYLRLLRLLDALTALAHKKAPLK